MIPPIGYIPYITYLQYGQQGLYVTELKYFKSIYDISKSLEMTGFKIENIPMIAGCLVAIGFIFRIIAFFALNASKPSSYMYKFASWLTNYKHHFTQLRKKWVKKNGSRVSLTDS